SRVQLAHARAEAVDVRRIQLGTALRLAVSPPGANVGIGQAVGFGALQGHELDEQPHPLVPPPRGGPLEHDCRERRVTPGSSSERRVPGRQEDQVVEIRAAKAERPAFTGEADPGVPAQLRLALAAGRFAAGNEDLRLWPGPGVFLIARRRIRVRHGAGAYSSL